MRSRLLATTLAFVLVTGACSGSTSSGTAVETASETAESDAASEQTTTPDDANATDESDPPADSDAADSIAADPSNLSVDDVVELLFPSFDPADNANREAQFAEEERERQVTIVECMAKQGFEYQPVDFGNEVFFGPGNDLDPTSREFIEEYGFGFSTFEDQFDVQEFEEEGAQTFQDPNQEYVDSLSDSARDAYYAALYGEQPEFDPSFTEEQFEEAFEENPDLFGPQGCEGEAFVESDQGKPPSRVPGVGRSAQRSLRTGSSRSSDRGIRARVVGLYGRCGFHVLDLQRHLRGTPEENGADLRVTRPIW